MTPNSAQRKQDATGETCPLRSNRRTLPTWCATAPRRRGNALAYEFEGRQTSFAEFDIKTNRVANALIALGVKPGERIAYLGKNSDIYFELLMGAMKANVVMAPVNWRLAGPEVAFIVGDCKAPVLFVGPEFITQVRNIKPQLPDVRTSSPPKAARRNGRILRRGAMPRAATIRRCRSARRTSRSSSIPRAPRASPRARCCRTPTSSIWCRPATRPRSPNGTNGRPTTSRWWRCRSSISAAPAGA